MPPTDSHYNHNAAQQPSCNTAQQACTGVPNHSRLLLICKRGALLYELTPGALNAAKPSKHPVECALGGGGDEVAHPQGTGGILHCRVPNTPCTHVSLLFGFTADPHDCQNTSKSGSGSSGTRGLSQVGPAAARSKDDIGNSNGQVVNAGQCLPR